MENELKHENFSDEISSPDENKTETSFIASTLPSSSSRKDESTTAQSKTGSTFYIPFCASVFYVMASSGFVCMIAMRVSLSVALVAMINQTAVTDDVVTINITNISNTDQCPRDPALQRADGEFTWDRHQQGALLAANFYGILITQVSSKDGNLATKTLVSRATHWLLSIFDYLCPIMSVEGSTYMHRSIVGELRFGLVIATMSLPSA